MKIYVVYHSGEGMPSSIHSAHYSEWMAKITTENKNEELRDKYGPGNLWEGYYYQETELTSEGD